jgi:HK97 family phage prohead protease
MSTHVCATCVKEIGSRPVDLSLLPQPQKSAHALMGKMVTFEVDGVRIVGRVEKQVSADNFSMKLAMPDVDGMLILTDSEIVHPVSGLEEVSAVANAKKMRVFEDTVPFEIERGKMQTIRDSDKAIMDYQDVVIAGFASTFKSVTPADRDGDYVLEKAFDKTLMEFRKNPVMLIDHQNRVDSLVGSYSKIGTSESGLAVEGRLSNAPEVRRVRFLVAEGHLKAFSIGGFFLYESDGKGIGEVKLYEISLIPIPANPDSLFHTRSLGMGDVVKCWNNHRKHLRAWIR